MFAIDKQTHFWAGMAIASACVAYSTAPWSAFTIMVAAGKEVWDKVSGTGTMDFLDFVATSVGAAAVLPLGVL